MPIEQQDLVAASESHLLGEEEELRGAQRHLLEGGEPSDRRRDPEDTRQVEFRVYDRQQAEFLLGFMMKAAPHVSVTLEQVDLGLDVFQPRKTGRPTIELTAAEADAKRAKEKRQAAERQRKRREKLRADRDVDPRGHLGRQQPGVDPTPSSTPSSRPSESPPSI